MEIATEQEVNAVNSEH